MSDDTLWDIPEMYPNTPGWKKRDTSREAAQSIDAKTLQDMTYKAIMVRPSTADEVAAHLNVDKLSIRPRCSELAKMEKIRDSGERRQNLSSGKKAVVWEVVV